MNRVGGYLCLVMRKKMGHFALERGGDSWIQGYCTVGEGDAVRFSI